jgi:hypothetical protein
MVKKAFVKVSLFDGNILRGFKDEGTLSLETLSCFANSGAISGRFRTNIGRPVVSLETAEINTASTV